MPGLISVPYSILPLTNLNYSPSFHRDLPRQPHPHTRQRPPYFPTGQPGAVRLYCALVPLLASSSLYGGLDHLLLFPDGKHRWGLHHSRENMP